VRRLVIRGMAMVVAMVMGAVVVRVVRAHGSSAYPEPPTGPTPWRSRAAVAFDRTFYQGDSRRSPRLEHSRSRA
jgi:hypothetical protein